MDTWTRQTVVVMVALALAGCCHGDGSSAPPLVTVTADIVTLSGQAGWPGATTLSVTIDGTAVPLTDGVWTHSLDLSGAAERTIHLAVIADGSTVALRDVAVRR